MNELRIFDIHDHETNRLLVTLEAHNPDEAIERLGAAQDSMPFLRVSGMIAMYERPLSEEPQVNSPFYFRDGFFLFLAASQPTHH